MGKLLGGRIPRVPPPPPPPVDTSQAVKDAEIEQRIRAASGGRASTVLTNPEEEDKDVVSAKKKLLGS
jgi:hypothetical protein